ncbi:MAG: NAD(P)/FAD-dependent oxidoreductase [Ectothiorhodospiraceae bacterium]|nr:NAD(P)/FAD-dependent oxidoreductase [Ectothiorhodospiraceae bacterium]MCH8503604.1 NAD(P)/FAD-dependent oxidoreductase [Ectothiorhodospiraceae bacterium]
MRREHPYSHAALDTSDMDAGRRRFLVAAAALTAGAATGFGTLLTPQPAAAFRTPARIVIVGAGAAGLSLASRLASALDGASITIVDRREEHYYQPGLTLVATGAWKASRVLDTNSRFIPRDVEWLRDSVVEYDPDNNRIHTATGQTVNYDFLLVASGLQLNFDAIEGMSPELIGSHGIGCVYDTPDHAERTWRAIRAFTETGGVGLFTRAPGAIKCAGAPLKVTMLAEHGLRTAGHRGKAELHYFQPGNALFSQPGIDSFLKQHFPEQRDIAINWEHQLKGLDAARQEATFVTAEGERVVEYDFIHVVPPMSAPVSVRESELAWQEGGFSGWLEVDPHTLQHRRYPNVFGVGDVIGTPIGKTAASVKAQTPVAVANLLSILRDRDPVASYNGYTSCPLITERGKGILVEFDYSLNMTPSFGFIDPYEEQWIPWLMKDRMLHAAYNAMLRGRI